MATLSISSPKNHGFNFLEFFNLSICLSSVSNPESNKKKNRDENKREKLKEINFGGK